MVHELFFDLEPDLEYDEEVEFSQSNEEKQDI